MICSLYQNIFAENIMKFSKIPFTENIVISIIDIYHIYRYQDILADNVMIYIVTYIIYTYH